MKYLKEQLATKANFNFHVIRGGMDDLIPRLDILADTLFLKVFVCSHTRYRDLTKPRRRRQRERQKTIG